MGGLTFAQRSVLDALLLCREDVGGTYVDLVRGGGVQVSVHDNPGLARWFVRLLGLDLDAPVTTSYTTFRTTRYRQAASLTAGGIEVTSFTKILDAQRAEQRVRAAW